MLDDNEIVMGRREMWGTITLGILLTISVSTLYVIRKSGSRETTLLRNLILQLIEAGRVGLIDPHGDLAGYTRPFRGTGSRMLSTSILRTREFPIGLNVLRTSGPQHLVVSGLLAGEVHWADSWGRASNTSSTLPSRP